VDGGRAVPGRAEAHPLALAALCAAQFVLVPAVAVAVAVVNVALVMSAVVLGVTFFLAVHTCRSGWASARRPPAWRSCP